jgi:sarcosine oxidase subunit beta
LEWLDGGGARLLEPAVSPEVIAASFCPSDAQVHPGALAAAWLQDAVAQGAAVVSGVLVDSFIMYRGAVRGVVASGTAFPAEAVVLAAGPWSGELAAMAGASVGVRPRRGVLLRGHSERVLASRPLLGASYLAAKFSDDPHAVAFSFQQHPDGTCILGGTREFAGFSTEGLDEAAARILECAGRYLAALREVAWAKPVAGFRPWTPDGLPRIGPSGVPGLYLACGHEGDGVTLAAATAEKIAQTLVENR